MDGGPSLENPGPRPGLDILQVEGTEGGGVAKRRTKKSRRRQFSTLTLRILAPNLVALGVLVGGIFYLDEYRDGLFDAKLAALQTEAKLISAAISGSTIAGPPEKRNIDPYLAAELIARLATPTRSRLRLFNREGILIADSRELTGASRQVQLRYLPPPDANSQFARAYNQFYDWVVKIAGGNSEFPPYQERWAQHARDYEEAARALNGIAGGAIRSSPSAALVITVAVPVEELRLVIGALLLSVDDRDVVESVRAARGAVIQAFAAALAITVFFSIFLAGTIERPLRNLAQAAERIRRWRGRRVEIPDYSRRRDEIGDLSVAVREMTSALYSRLDAIEAFAADVAHEIKNPLTSIHSAVESLPLMKDEAQRGKLHALIMDDIARLNRLISDISNASRVDAEMVRAPTEWIDLAALLSTAVEIHSQQAAEKGIRIEMFLPPRHSLAIEGVPGRIGQVFDNLLSNARSFSPAGGTITVRLEEDQGQALVQVDDEGPGMREGEEEQVFGRFYSRRPETEAFGQHSGLGLSISRQIVDAHDGEIHGQNRHHPDGSIIGARFTVSLPLTK